MNKLLPNLYLDIGNTNIKYCFDDDKIYTVDSNLYELSYIFDKYLHNHNIYLINVNFELNKFIKENTNKNLFIFDKEKYHNEFNLQKKFDYKEIGDDIYFMINFLIESNLSNYLLVSYGTYTVYLIIKNNLIESIQIELGNDAINKFLANKFDLEFFKLKPNLVNGNNTINAINSATYFRTIGTIEEIKKYYKFSNNEIIFCGNGISNTITNNFQDCNVINNLVLLSFKKWCIKKFMKK